MSSDLLQSSIRRGAFGAVARGSGSEYLARISDLSAQVSSQGHQIAQLSKQFTAIQAQFEMLLKERDRVIDAHTAKSITPFKVPTIRRIIEACAGAYGLGVSEVLSEGRFEGVVWPRQVAMFLSRRITGRSMPKIARAFGGYDHTTVMHSCKKVAQSIKDDPTTHKNVAAIARSLGWNFDKGEPINPEPEKPE